MSKHHQVFEDIRLLSKEELEEQYYINIADDGEVFDTCESRLFPDLDAWAEFMALLEEEESHGTFQKITGKQRFDDE